jgi:hypothetical protein
MDSAFATRLHILLKAGCTHKCCDLLQQNCEKARSTRQIDIDPNFTFSYNFSYRTDTDQQRSRKDQLSGSGFHS